MQKSPIIYHAVFITNYTLTSHAKERMKERAISEKVIENALQNPTKITYNDRNRLLIKKSYKKKKQK